MVYPRLVPQRLCTADVIVTFKDGIDISGREKTIGQFVGRCNLSLKSKQIMTAEKKLVTMAAVALFDGDIAPYNNTISGEVKCEQLFSLDTECLEHLETEKGKVLDFSSYEGRSFKIYSSAKEKNPDGSVNYTRLELV